MQLFMRFPQNRKKALTLSYDDGVDTDVKMVETLNRYGIKATFNLNSGLFSEKPREADNDHYFYHLTKDEAQALYANSGHEVAVHTLNHLHLEELTADVISSEINKDKQNLEQMFGCVVRGMAYPYGTYNDTVVKTAAACGIVYSRTIVSTGGFELPNDWLRMPATCHHNDPMLMEYADRFLTLENANPWLFYLWGHTYEFRSDNNWEVIERFAEKMGCRDNIWYATNIEVYDYTQAFRALSFDVDYSRVYNPSALDVYFCLDGIDYVAKAGVTTKLR